MVVRKRKTTRTGKNTQKTRTISSTGKVTQSFSSKPPGGPTRRTVSFSNGKMRTTHSTKMGVFTRITTKTISLINQPKQNSTVKNKRRTDDGDISWYELLKTLVLAGFAWMGIVILIAVFLYVSGH
jgi:hypothetical protein